MFSFFKDNKLKRDELTTITTKFVEESNQYEIFKIPDELYLKCLEELKHILNKYPLSSDDRFVTYGRLSLLREELTQRLNDDKLRNEEPNWKEKWDNRLGAFWDLFDYVRGDRFISLGNIPEGVNAKNLIMKNDEYYKDGYICSQEKEILISMIDEMITFINREENMTKVSNRNIKCAKCGKESEQLMVFSVNYMLGDKESNDKLMSHQQKCPHCGYEASDISVVPTEDKYDIDPEDNVPQFVYGVPDFLRDKKDEQELQGKIIFDAFEGGYFGPSEYYYIEKNEETYIFKYGHNSAGANMGPFDKFLQNNCYDEKFYNRFIEQLKEMTHDWAIEYVNRGVMDGTQWHIKIMDENIEFNGSNDFPENYNKVKKYIDSIFIKNGNKCDIEPEDNIPREVYGIPRPLNKKDNAEQKYDINPEDNVPQRVYGVMNPKNIELNLDKREKESISILIKDYCITLIKLDDNCNLVFMNNSKADYIKEPMVSISSQKFDLFFDRLNTITQEWNDTYNGTRNINWQVKYDTKKLDKTYSGNGEYPTNWNKFIDLVSEYELLFKKVLAQENETLTNNDSVESHI